MFEFFKITITGFNAIPTTILGFVMLYWIIVIVGFLDLDFLDFDGDFDADEPWYGLLMFLNVAELPFMLILSIISFIFWLLTMILHVFSFKTGGLLTGILLLPILIASMILSKYISLLFKPLFRDAYNIDEKEIIKGKCILLSNISYDRLGQAEIKRDGAPFVINVKTIDDEEMKIGDEALVLKKDSKKDFYIIKKFRGVK